MEKFWLENKTRIFAYLAMSLGFKNTDKEVKFWIVKTAARARQADHIPAKLRSIGCGFAPVVNRAPKKSSLHLKKLKSWQKWSMNDGLQKDSWMDGLLAKKTMKRKQVHTLFHGTI